MRKMIIIGTIAALLLSSCSSGPEATAKKFTENLAMGKVNEAKKYTTESTGKFLDLASGFGGLPVNPNFKFVPVKDSVVDNTAWITYKNETGKVQEKLMLVKIEGEWLVHMEKEK
jgi:hypothetical protein